jgi:hypothetical protein
MTDPGSTKRPRLFSFLFLLACAGLAVQDENPGIRNPVTRFGGVFLSKSDLVAEVHVNRVYRLGMGVDVVRVRLDRVLYSRLPADLERRAEQMVLSHRGEFREDTGLLLVLKRFGSGDRLITIHRISNLEKYYEDKVALVEDYIRIERMPHGKAKRKAFVKMLFLNLKKKSPWLQGSGVKELDWLLEEKRYTFTTGDVAYLERVEATMENEPLKRSLRTLREAVSAVAVEGPAAVEKPPEPAAEEEETESPS